MAVRKVEISQDALTAIGNCGIKLSELTKEEFDDKINSFIIAGTDKIELSSENLLLLDNILKFASNLNKSDEIQANLKIKLKELHKELIENL